MELKLVGHVRRPEAAARRRCAAVRAAPASRPVAIWARIDGPLGDPGGREAVGLFEDGAAGPL